MKRIWAFLLIAVLVLNLGMAAFAEGEQEEQKEIVDYYVEVTNEDGSDPVYIALDDTNSTADPETDQPEYNEDLQEEDKEYTTIEMEHADDTVYEITEEKTSVEDLVVGETYVFAEENDLESGDIIDTPTAGGAELEFVGEGKDEILPHIERISPTEYGTYYPEPFDLSVSEIFQEEIAMLEEYVVYAEEQNALRELYGGDSVTCIEDIALPVAKEYIENTIKNKKGTAEGLESLTTVDEVIGFYCDWLASSRWATSSEDLAEEYGTYEAYRQHIKEQRSEQLLATIEKRQTRAYDRLFNHDVRDPHKYDDLLAELKAIDAEDEAAILAYFGMTREQVITFKTNLNESNTPIVINSGIVNVVTPGSGFDDCPQGAIFYDESYGWSYACTQGGVQMGDATDLHLYATETYVLGSEAFTVSAGDAVKLNKDGTGIAGLKNVKAYVTLPDGTKQEIISFEFKEDYVELGKDVHVTAIIGGRLYTVTLDLIKWVEEQTEEIPVTIKPIVSAIEKLSNRINNDRFGSIVKDADYNDETYYSKAVVEDKDLYIVATFEDDIEALRRAVLNSDVLEAIADIEVNNIIFTLGERTFTIAADQIENYDEVTITIDPDTDTYVIATKGGDRAEDLLFAVGEHDITIAADQLSGSDEVIVTVDPATDECTVSVNGSDVTADAIAA